MKKIYSLALMAFMGAAVANAQALKLDKNYVIYTEHDGETSMADAMPMVDKDNYFYFPVQGGQLNEAVHHLTKDYTDPETGVSFKAGDYKFISAKSEIKFKHGSTDEGYPQGLSNVKKVIYYIGGNGSLGTYVRMTQKDEDGDNYVHFEGNPTNRAWSYYFAPDLTFKSTPEKIGENTWYTADDSELTYSSPIKLTVDLTNNIDGTDDEISTAKYNVNSTTGNENLTTGSFSGAWYYTYDGGDITEKRMLLQFYEKEVDADNKVSQGTNKIAWSADNRYGIALKNNAFLMAVVFICGDENAETEVIRMKADDETGISNVVANGSAKSNEMYNLAGQRIAAPVSGQIYIQNGKKYIAK